MCVVRVFGPPHAAADGNDEAFEASRPRDGDQTEILRIDVDVVRRRNDEADLELTRHVGGSVKGLLCFRARHPLLAIPDLMIGARPGDHMLAKLLGERREIGSASCRESVWQSV